jgi:hypothetical protein
MNEKPKFQSASESWSACGETTRRAPFVAMVTIQNRGYDLWGYCTGSGPHAGAAWSCLEKRPNLKWALLWYKMSQDQTY